MASNDGKSTKHFKSRGLNRKSATTADWVTADALTLQRAISAAAITGGALRFGYSRDGGAYAIGIYGDGEPYTEFLKPGEDLDEFLCEVITLFETILDDLMATRAQAQRLPPRQQEGPGGGQPTF